MKIKKKWVMVKNKIVAVGIILVLIFLMACSVLEGNKKNIFNLYIDEDFGNMFEFSIAELNIKLLSSDFILEEYSFENFETKITISGLEKEFYDASIEVVLENGETFNANSRIDFSTQDYCDGKLEAIDGYVKIILKLDTNPADSIYFENFKNLNLKAHYFKQYEISNAQNIAEAYTQTPMNYFVKHIINYDILDENMIPIIEYDFGSFRNPVSTAHNAFACYKEYIDTGNPEYLEWFYANVDWLIDYKDENGYLRYEFDWYHYYGLMEAGWVSAMAQGEALSAVCMAYHASDDEKYLHAAELFFHTMYTNNDQLWCFGIDDEDYLWYEEYPNEDFCHVLNGKLFGMWGLWNYYCITEDEFALALFQGGLASVFDNYPIWNFVGSDGSRYCKHENSCSNYHPIHLDELRKYRDFFGIEEFNDIIETFQEY